MIFERLPRVGRAERLRARGRARAGGVARAHRRTPEPPRAARAERRGAGRDRTPPARLARGPDAHSRRRRERAGRARRGPARRGRTGAPAPARAGPAEHPRGAAQARGHAARGARRGAAAHAGARRPGSRTSCWRRRPTCRRSWRRCGRAPASRPTCAQLRGWRGELVGDELEQLLGGELALSVAREGRDHTLRVEPRG